jgi:hypothetical protein
LSPEIGKDKVIDRLIEHAESNAHVVTRNGQVALNSLGASLDFHDISSFVTEIDPFKLTRVNLDKIPVQVPSPSNKNLPRSSRSTNVSAPSSGSRRGRGSICFGGSYEWLIFATPGTSGISAGGRITMRINRCLSVCYGI